ncbi:VOC family protein [Bacillus swezeyi]|uniref:Glyoxalase/bleomycin resistance/dioxygenase family protein n=1 Tax=Bacillus swezeyi TaxID=1925020 RepID=A0A1R1QWV9_9BACI|nr:VOC family protein [Bacillus swezeyi]MEC1259147.1 VOC family protein [Bacillus swezeyi]MED1740472.1 VOC family protein [Bacillus swezeyi]MED2927892.1 VOC family protein [Bacillus swezeyi]MED2965196.1 VOC family protein [Bacillus swezeyi]MED3071457.1 VOC family protein [Bacillus swezeyi]
MARIDHVGLMVKDIEASITFYQDIVGMTLKDKMTHTNGIMKLAFLGFENSEETELELIQGYNDNLPAEGKVHHFAISTDDIDAELTRMRENEVKLMEDGITTLPNGYRYFFIFGPEGEAIEFFQRT